MQRRAVVTLLKPPEATQDDIGHKRADIDDYIPYNVDAFIEDIGGREQLEDVGLVVDAKRRYKIVASPLYRDDLDTRWLIRDGSTIYNVDDVKVATYSPNFLLVFGSRR